MRTREAAARAAEATTTNIPNACQLQTRIWFDVASVGDFDGDGAADAEDGWKKEPVSARHSDRNPPRGVPVSYLGGSHDNGHRAISLGNGKIRSTDAAGLGRVATVPLDWPEKTWGLKYVGWSETMNGLMIPREETDRVSPLKVHGVDISGHQRAIKIDWAALRGAGVKWMYHKASEGSMFQDASYGVRRIQAKQNKFPFGAYHFARPSGGDAKQEARFFIDTARPVPGDLRPALDLETREFVRGSALVRWADDFCNEVERLTGVVPVVYTPYLLSQELEDKAIFWVPRYNKTNERPVRDWDIFQFSNGELGVPNSVPGLGHVDLNYSPRVSLAELRIDKPEPVPTSRGRNVDHALENLIKAEKLAKGPRLSKIQAAIDALKAIAGR